MGMQVHFDRSDCDPKHTVFDNQDGCWSIVSYQQIIYAWSTDDGQSFWFDCGSRSASQMANIEALIAARICFRAS